MLIIIIITVVLITTDNVSIRNSLSNFRESF